MKYDFIMCYRTESNLESARIEFIELQNKVPDLFSIKKYFNILSLKSPFAPEFPFTLVLECKNDEDSNKLDDLLVKDSKIYIRNCEPYMLSGREHEVDKMIYLKEEEDCEYGEFELHHFLPIDVIETSLKIIRTGRSMGLKTIDPETINMLKILLNKNRHRFKKDTITVDLLAYLIASEYEGVQ